MIKFPDTLFALSKSRIALVIGNSDYEKIRLKNPINDANDFAVVLHSLNFTVTKLINASRREIENAIRGFGLQLRDSGGTGLFYFAGHGVQVNGRNYLIPVNTTIESESDVEFEAVDAGRVLGKMQDAGNEVNIVILDACRDNPFARSFRSHSRGLGQVKAPKGSFIAYATAPGKVAADGDGRNGIFTQYLMKYLLTPGLTIEQTMNRTRLDVTTATKDKQIPWHASSLIGDVVLMASNSAAVTTKISSKGTVLSVRANVDDAEILVDGKLVGKTPLKNHQLTPGKYNIKVQKSGYKTYSRKIKFESDREQALYIELIKPDQRKSRLYVDTIPDNAKISLLDYLDIFYQGMEIEPGSYTIEMSASGYISKKQDVVIRNGEDKRISVSLKRIGIDSNLPVEKSFNTWREPNTGIEFTWIQPGCFLMGQTDTEKGILIKRLGDKKYTDFMDELPKHRVCLDGFWMARYEVTNQQFRLFKPAHSSGDHNGISLDGEDLPVVQISWEDAASFAKWLTNKNRSAYQFGLPTEAEWEHACKAGSKTSMNLSDTEDGICQYANVHDQSSKRKNDFKWEELDCDDKFAVAAPVGEFNKNAFGLHDMLGNVWEWCQDTYFSDAYSRHAVNNPMIEGEGQKVIRGGSWISTRENVRCAIRGGDLPDSKNIDIGFRIVMVP